MRLAWIAAGGVCGSLARWFTEGAFASSPGAFPWGTLVVNVGGALALGALGVALQRSVVAWPHLRAFFAIGVLGSFTTFSTMAVEGVIRIDQGRVGVALVYWAVTLIAGLAAAAAGVSVARWVWITRRSDGTHR